MLRKRVTVQNLIVVQETEIVLRQATIIRH